MNVYEVITSRILESLQQGVVPWRKPWSSDLPRNLVSGREYRGVNVLLLQSASFTSPYWMTYRQAQALGGTVKRGERGCPIVFWKVSQRDETDGTTGKGFILRYFTVFNAAQTEGIEVPAPPERRAFDANTECDRLVASYANPPEIQHGGARACYFPSSDLIQMPEKEQFASTADYYSTLFHELTHSTGAQHRLGRKGVVNGASYSNHSYAFEELVAECGSAFLAAHAGISPATLENSAAYIASWVKRLRSEPRWIVEAASQAAKAVDLILGNAACATTADQEVAA
jgi:antirestriction protein ArdC